MGGVGVCWEVNGARRRTFITRFSDAAHRLRLQTSAGVELDNLHILVQTTNEVADTLRAVRLCALRSVLVLETNQKPLTDRLPSLAVQGVP